MKLGLAYAAYIEGKVVKAMSSAITAPIAGAQGISGYIASGMSDSNWLTVSRNVQLANGGSDVYALGTKIALANVLPAATANSGFRYGEDGAIVKSGYLPEYKGVPLIELGNALVPNTVNGTPATIVPDDVIYFLPMAMHKPVKVVMEGSTLTVEKDPLAMADHTYVMTINMMIGCDVVIGSKFGAINL